MKLTIPTRKQVIKKHKKEGDKVAAVFPISYPRELLRAHRFLPVEVWGPPGIDDSGGGAHLQTYTCSIVRNGLSFVLSGGLDQVDMILVPNACDSLQGLGSVLLDFVKPEIPVLTFYPPRATRPADSEYLCRELEDLNVKLSKISGLDPSSDELTQAIDEEAEADLALARLHREHSKIPLSDFDRYRLIRSREYLPLETFMKKAKSVLDKKKVKKEAKNTRLVLSGIIPEPMEILESLDQMDAQIVADDLACCGRRLYPSGTSDDPWQRMTERLFGAAPDPMRGSSIQGRIDHLLKLVRESEAQGVVFYNIKFCEPESFDIPQVREALKKAGIPSIVLEVDLEDQLSGQIETRLEAFMEMV